MRAHAITTTTDPYAEGGPLRILIVDDHPVTRGGLRAALSTSSQVQVVGEAASGREAVEACDDLGPDVVFMDVRMPGMSGIEATRVIRRNHPETKVILFTVDESRAAIAEAIQAGISGYLLKDVGARELVDAARNAVDGVPVIHPSLTRALFEEFQAATERARPEAPLSRRETQILQRVAYGATTREVAHELGISAHTVKTHLERIFDKLGANDRAQAVAIALRLGLVN
jgi:DNA-binding NarL/FixJ family response regulator